MSATIWNMNVAASLHVIDLDWKSGIRTITMPRVRARGSHIDYIKSLTSAPATEEYPFVHPREARFNTLDFGALYVAGNLKTSVIEAKYHREKFMGQSNESPQLCLMQIYRVDFSASLHDLRGVNLPKVFDPSDYFASQKLAEELHAKSSSGVVYESVRHRGGECVALFKRQSVRSCDLYREITYRWDGVGLLGEQNHCLAV